MIYNCTRFRENISKAFRDDSVTEVSKGHNYIKATGGVTVLSLCTSPDNALYLIQVL